MRDLPRSSARRHGTTHPSVSSASSSVVRIVSALALAGGLTGLGTLGLGALSAPVSADPGGNNGTVKISETPIDKVPDNDPHVGCTLRVQWYGFDSGATSTISFELVSPTEGTVTVEGPLTVELEADPAGGGKDPDGDVVYVMHPSAIPHPEQGFHEKITVHTTWSNGSDQKSKVIWFKDCAPSTEPSTPPSSTPPSTEPSTSPTTEPSTEPSTAASTPAASTPPSSVDSSAPPSAVSATSAAASASTATDDSPDTPSASPAASSDSVTPPTVVDAGLAGQSSALTPSPVSRTGLWLAAGSALAAALGLFGLARRRGLHRR